MPALDGSCCEASHGSLRDERSRGVDRRNAVPEFRLHRRPLHRRPLHRFQLHRAAAPRDVQVDSIASRCRLHDAFRFINIEEERMRCRSRFPPRAGTHEITVRFTLRAAGTIRIALSNSLGGEVSRQEMDRMEAGLHAVVLPVENLPGGGTWFGWRPMVVRSRSSWCIDAALRTRPAPLKVSGRRSPTSGTVRRWRCRRLIGGLPVRSVCDALRMKSWDGSRLHDVPTHVERLLADARGEASQRRHHISPCEAGAFICGRTVCIGSGAAAIVHTRFSHPQPFRCKPGSLHACADLRERCLACR